MSSDERHTDHPRSRGVYEAHHSRRLSRAGSSPLARGLRAPRDHAAGKRRIIPARAGFTPPPTGWRGPSWDHPRSRGVYDKVQTALLYEQGSSPLARGLRIGRSRARTATRIIPARAGFTSPRGRMVFVAGDHPRSRGVYSEVLGCEDSKYGSSPLARGLHPENLRGRVHRRIIPARAGFTDGASDRSPHLRDHPRSRGVYNPMRTVVAVILGSSPLARGLLPITTRAA